MHTDEPRKNPLTELGYETEDLNFRGVGKGAWVFFLFTFGSILIGGLLFYWMDPDGMKAMREPQHPFANKVPQPPNPLLQTNVTAKMDTRDLRAMEENSLSTPAYVNQTKGIVRIPIDRAIELTVDRMKNGDVPQASLPSAAPSAVPNPITGATPGVAPAEPTTPSAPAVSPRPRLQTPNGSHAPGIGMPQ